jgi:hypothetical protein
MTVTMTVVPALALRRDAPVVCARCGRIVPRQARQQTYCSARCRKSANQRSRKAFLGRDTGAPTNPPKKVNGFNTFGPSKSGSSIALQGPSRVLAAEVFNGRDWRQVVSLDGVVCQVGTLRQRALRTNGTTKAR